MERRKQASKLERWGERKEGKKRQASKGKNETNKQTNGRDNATPRKYGWLCGMLPKTLTLFMTTKIRDFLSSDNDLTKNQFPYS